MREIRFDRTQDIPIVSLKIFGPRESTRVNIVFDTGSAITQIDTDLIETIGYSAIDAVQLMSVRGAVGEAQEGYVVKMKKLRIFGIDFHNVPVLTYDFDNFAEYGVDGLLGFDVIKDLHLELIGHEGKLIVKS